MEELQKKHRQEQKDLQARVTQKKKNANKKTRKGVNDECVELERELRERQLAEIAAIDGGEEAIRDSEPELDVNDDIPSQQSHAGIVTEAENQPVKKRNRQKERLARRAAEQEEAAAKAEEEASNQTDHRAKEREVMQSQLDVRGLVEQEVRSDGHCMYAAMADQLKQNGKQVDYKDVRQDAAAFIQAHPDDFAPFLEEPLDEYVVKIRDTAEWGGQLELTALSKHYGIIINVLQGDGRVEKIEPETRAEKDVWLAYYRHSFGLGEHYNSLRKKI